MRPYGVQFMQGNEACVYGAIDAGARFYGGYPITPSSEIAELSAELLPQVDGIFLQMEDEIGSIATIIGASAAGKKSYTATSGPGFSLMQENLGMAVYAEVPIVLINIQRNGPSTALATRPAQGDVMQSRWGTHGDHPIIVLSPASVQECYDLTVRAFNLSEKYRIPVILLGDEVIGHMRESLIIPELDELKIINRKTPSAPAEGFKPYTPGEDDIPAIPPYGTDHIVHISSSCHDESGYSHNAPQTADKLVRRLHRKIENNKTDIVQVEWFGPDDAEVTLIAYGVVSRAAKQAVIDAQKEGLSVNLLRLITQWPFADEQVREALKKAKAVIVPELNLGQVVLEVERTNSFKTPVFPLSRIDGEIILPSQIVERIKEVLK
ncbi:2-oxoacid:acceptor oxidoreductase subunit alpha [Desulfosporosinus sp.]|uniref:2-oxoacid:acceptor oxidoreductase subunit alpha n=1 Tax=Desulfosporosinus sp. TaxID=157907 RepID=UPI0025C5F6D1|nr:2-oxoacid:acceptor oxidoreductase subunit alpha [Desulfosporosinus sp.]MBC2722244.1 2-oxoacid:acceptor oxidoreductase subunit alpha [Desulfosporosinus sp.]MBC2725200.1 2-oxoacid:acceptor oxidoreductase subunit alpha [Desulfosporosinus sp.]